MITQRTSITPETPCHTGSVSLGSENQAVRSIFEALTADPTRVEDRTSGRDRETIRHFLIPMHPAIKRVAFALFFPSSWVMHDPV